jgi:hypothetical protein
MQAPLFSAEPILRHNGSDVLRLGAFLALDNNELDPLPFFKGAIPVAYDGTIVNKDVFAFITFDKAKAFSGVKPLHRASHAFSHDPEPPFSKFC